MEVRPRDQAQDLKEALQERLTSASASECSWRTSPYKI